MRGADAVGFVGHYNYWIVIFLMMAGFYVVIARGNLIKKLVGLNVFQASVFVLYISMGKVTGGTAPIIGEGITTYSNPLPHVLILTAIVVGVATTARGRARGVRSNPPNPPNEEDDIQDQDEEP